MKIISIFNNGSILFEKTPMILIFFITGFLIGCVMGESIATAEKNQEICLGRSEECKLLNRWYRQGKAAGNIGDWYDNRDGGHSLLGVKSYPQLSVVDYTEYEKTKKLHWGGQKRLLKQITIGNSSTSASVRSVGSNPRSHYYIWSKGLEFLYAQYRTSNLYVYPEHRDHDEGHNGRPGYGDLYPTNTPYLVISQGSSGSDKVFVRAFIRTLAAFRPDVKQRMREAGLLMPTMQMILRTSNKNIRSKKEYLSGKAHPTVFEGKLLNPRKMIETANRIRLNDIPPMVALRVVEEDRAIKGMDFFEAEGSEKLADTPAVIARIFRRTAYAKRMVVSAEHSADINKRQLTYHWVVLRGDTDRISINTSKGGAVAELIIPYHARQPISNGAGIASNRVDIGVFVHNGAWYSAPGFVTVFFLDNEVRSYDANGRILDIYYNASDATIGYNTGDTKAFINKKYDIFDWVEMFDTILSKSDELPPLLLREQFSEVEIKEIAESAASFKSAFEEHTELNEKRKSLQSILNKSRQHRKDSIKYREDAEVAFHSNPNAEAKAAYDRAKDEYDDALKNEKQAKENINAIRKDQKVLDKHLKDIMHSEKREIQMSIKKLMENALNRIKNNPYLYVENKKVICALLNEDDSRKKKIEAAKKKLVKYGLRFNQKVDAFESKGVMTSVEKYLVQQFNLVLMNEVLFPNFLNRRDIKNFVDSRLSTPKTWRDVYRYDKAGNNLGWTRYDGDTISEYTPAGNKVISKNENGLVSKVQPVEYIIDKKENMLIPVPVDAVDTHSRISKKASGNKRIRK